MITKQDAVLAPSGQELWHATAKNADGTPLRVRVNGRCKTWKTRPEEFRLPIKHGLYSHGQIDHHTAHSWCLPLRWAIEQHYTK